MKTALQNQLQDGIRLLRTRQLEQARVLAESMLRQFPESPEAYLYAADAASLCGDRKRAIAVMDEILQRHPAEPQLLVRKAQLLFNDSQRTAALAVARQVATSEAQNEWQLRSIGRIFSDCQDLRGAREWLLNAAEKLPDSRAILADLALTEFHLNLPTEAELHVEALLKLEPFHPSALHLRSLLCTQTAERNHVSDLQDRLSRGPDHPNLVTAACYALAKEYEDLGQYRESFDALLDDRPQRASTLVGKRPQIHQLHIHLDAPCLDP